jgi:ABC-type Mn2+/Zn2+ transport system ATPase subunit
VSEGAPALEAKGVSVLVDGRPILENVSLTVDRGQFVCLCGPNGGGKTTFVKAALGLLPITTGSIEVLGDPPSRGRLRAGYVPQRTTFDRRFPASVADLIVANLRGRWPLHLRPSERRTAREVLARVGGEDLLDKPLAALSGGETQRAFLARALVREPDLLLLDEPTAGIDQQGRAEFLDLLARMAEEGKSACLLVTHNRAAIDRVAQKVVYLDRTVVAAGRPEEVFSGEGPRLAVGRHDHHALGAVCEEE